MKKLGDVPINIAPPSGPVVAVPPPCPHCGGAGWRVADALWGDPDWGKLIACECTRELMEQRTHDRVRRLLRLVPAAQRGYNFDTFEERFPRPSSTQRQAVIAARRYAQDPHSTLIFHGPFGSGKTGLSACIVNHLLERGVTAAIAEVKELLDELRAGFRDGAERDYHEVMELYQNVFVLVLDDYPEEEQINKFATSKLEQIVNHRHAEGLPMVVTTNLEPKELRPHKVRVRLTDESRTKTLYVSAS